MEEKKICEVYDEQGNKKSLEIISIFKIEGYKGKYALGVCNDEDNHNIYSYRVIENFNNLILEEINDQKIEEIIKKMIDTLLR